MSGHQSITSKEIAVLRKIVRQESCAYIPCWQCPFSVARLNMCGSYILDDVKITLYARTALQMIDNEIEKELLGEQ